MVRLTLSNVNEYKNVHLHDAKLGNILCDYCGHLVAIDFELRQNGIMRKARLEFEKVKSLTVGISEPWGESPYVFELIAESGDASLNNIEDTRGINRCFLTTLLLNSGDRIKVVSEVLKHDTQDI